MTTITEQCSLCLGTGDVSNMNHLGVLGRTCPKCEGRGSVSLPDEATQVRREVMEFKQRLDGWGWVGTEVFQESHTCYRVESTPMAHQTKQKVWIYWNVDGVTAQACPPSEGDSNAR